MKFSPAVTDAGTWRGRLRASLAVFVIFLCGEGPAAGEVAIRERVTARSPTGERAVEGRVVVEAVDGGVLLETVDSRLELFQPTDIVSRERLADDRPAAERPEAIGRRILAELPEGFELLVTQHYCICHDTSRAYAKWCAAVFERLHEAFGNFWRKAGFELVDAGRPLVVVIFADQRRYAAYAAESLGPAADRVAGYYDLMSNRVITYDLTGSDLLRDARPVDVGAKLGILASPAASGLVATLVHEATHQMAYNGGMHRRLAPVPLWASEGIAMYFETPDLRSTHGWSGVGQVNTARLEQWRKGRRPGGAAAVILDDAPFRDPGSGLQAYADAWALTYFLMQTRRAEFIDYVRVLAAKPPLSEDSVDRRRADFRVAFGIEPEEIEPSFERFMARPRPR